MLNKLKDMILGTVSDNTSNHNNTIDNKKRLQAATYALFIELAQSDDEFVDDEKELIYDIIKNQFGLDADEMDELLELAKQSMNRSVSLYEYTDIINKNYTNEEKYEVLKNLWRLILVDGKLDAHEEYFIRKISHNLHMDHKDLISAKIEIKKEIDF